MLGFTARALTRDVRVDGHEIETARWFSRAEMRAAVEDGSVMIPAGVSISSSLLEHWYGERLVSPGW
jgi:NAD+ diphosphatase